MTAEETWAQLLQKLTRPPQGTITLEVHWNRQSPFQTDYDLRVWEGGPGQAPAAPVSPPPFQPLTLRDADEAPNERRERLITEMREKKRQLDASVTSLRSSIDALLLDIQHEGSTADSQEWEDRARTWEHFLGHWPEYLRQSREQLAEEKRQAERREKREAILLQAQELERVAQEAYARATAAREEAKGLMEEEGSGDVAPRTRPCCCYHCGLTGVKRAARCPRAPEHHLWSRDDANGTWHRRM